MSWVEKVAAALVKLEKPSPKTSVAQLREIIDDVVIGKTSTEIVEKHGIDPVKTVLARVTTATQGSQKVQPLADGGWYAFRGRAQPYSVAPGFVAEWKKARGIA
jgi:hypothetical protein